MTSQEAINRFKSHKFVEVGRNSEMCAWCRIILPKSINAELIPWCTKDKKVITR